MALIEHLQIQNFKSLEDFSISPKLITILIGPNGSGKSSILQALILLKQSRGVNNLVTSGALLQLGNFDDIVTQHDPSRRMTFSFSGTRHSPRLSISRQDVRYKYELVVDRSGPVRNSLHLEGEFPPTDVAWIRDVQVGAIQVQQVNIGGISVLYSPVQAVGIPFMYRGTSRQQELPPDTVEQLNNFVLDLFNTVLNVLGNIYLVPASRSLDQPNYSLIPQPTDDLVSSGGSGAQGGQVAARLGYKRKLEPLISRLMEQITSVRVRGNLAPGPQLNILTTNRDLDNIVVNEGFGTNQLIFLLTQLVDAPPGALIAIEEPEIHLHPRAQAALASVLVETALQANKQLLLTTHSEHFMIALLTKLAEGALTHEQLAIYYVDRPDAATFVKELVIDEHGRIKGGLEGFFETDIAEFESYLKAISQGVDRDKK